MRGVFINNLLRAAETDSNIVLLTADLGYRALEEFRSRFPKQFCNAGAAEANMIGVASGLAQAGKKVFVYSIAPFVTMRVYEQIRNDLCVDNLNVKLIATGGGFSYGMQGISHNTMEDLAIMRALPRMSVLVPADVWEAEAASRFVIAGAGPTYLRLGKANQAIHRQIPDIKLGQGIVVQNGVDLTLIGIGNIMNVVVGVAKIIQHAGKSVRVISAVTLKPLDKDLILTAAKETTALFTIEEHSLFGGLGGAVAEILLESKYSDIIFKRFAIPDAYRQIVGSQEYLRQRHGLSAADISRAIMNMVTSTS